MMAMSLKRDVDPASLPATTTEASEAEPEAEDDFRSGDQSSDSAPKMPLHSGLSALIQAATSQLGHIDDVTTVRNGGIGSSEPTQNESSSSARAAPRYTPHGFHTTMATTVATGTLQDGHSRRLSSSLNGRTLSLQASEVRKQTFPEVLMTVLEDSANANVITFLPDGKYFAVRRKEFTETTMLNYFSVASFEDFLDKVHGWGFSRIERGVSPSKCHPSSSHLQRPAGIEIFRHPMFVKGDWEKCSRICYGESPTEVRLSALPDRARIEYTLSDESTLTASKRRLSPSHTGNESVTLTTSKQRVSAEEGNLLLNLQQGTGSRRNSCEIPPVSKSDSADTNSSAEASAHAALHSLATVTEAAAQAVQSEDDVRSLALAITTEKLNLKTDVEESVEASTPLVERAVENATHTIVTDAIETLLRDEGHTRETYLKHEQELSRSSLPGIVPISKQLFSPPPPPPGAAAGAGSTAKTPVRRRKSTNGGRQKPRPSSEAPSSGVGTRSSSRRSSRDPSVASVLTSNNNSSSLGVVMSTANNT